jgi:hypothetical protein
VSYSNSRTRTQLIEFVTDIIAESRTIFQWNEKLIRELDDICAKISPPSPPPYPDVSTTTRHNFFDVASQYKYFFVLLILTAFLVLRRLL